MKKGKPESTPFDDGPVQEISDADWEAAHNPAPFTPEEMMKMAEAEVEFRKEQEAEGQASLEKLERINNMRVARMELELKLIKQPWHI